MLKTFLLDEHIFFFSGILRFHILKYVTYVSLIKTKEVETDKIPAFKETMLLAKNNNNNEKETKEAQIQRSR